ncbi:MULTISPECIES: fumarylacetoacetate hydrolase family protein [Sanguibacteroides]|uniref:Fumarylacetoacetate hydrolase n=1 Tax=Sanguibacteroides justesenii TaxID=1547597 RepID=A0A0C3NKA6_9PORP|nr:MULTISPECIES: fumarylacetoacetate hydrolase family protein [Sanguibacteroides]KIO46652.1 fumarylacetoacetate hydrolase [Sanguibacteroides justesenii]KIO46969.1 fumarylacetoacetate hydrolase [Sanguibacteroides justesenii]PXZ43584.1 fumarylacetoacetate hydrolase [Sanguibacteroides justesenii]
MKLLCTEYNVFGERTGVTLGDNALLRNNEDFYLPAFATELSCVPQLVLRICKIGKCVSERFASRYYEEVGIGIRFYADNRERELLEKGLSPAVAYSFDGAAAISSLCSRDKIRGEYILELNGKEIFRGNVTDSSVTPEQVIAAMSEYYMLKIGDYIYCGNPFRYRGLQIGDHLKGYLDGKLLLDFCIR